MEAKTQRQRFERAQSMGRWLNRLLSGGFCCEQFNLMAEVYPRCEPTYPPFVERNCLQAAPSRGS
jgi:hypothetical protein